MNDNARQCQEDPPEYPIDKCESIPVTRTVNGPSPVVWARMSMPLDRQQVSSSGE